MTKRNCKTSPTECKLSNKLAKEVFGTLAGTAVKEAKKTGAFVIPGLGKLVRVERKARMGRNPATGEAISIPAKRTAESSAQGNSRRASARRASPVLREAALRAGATSAGRVPLWASGEARLT